MDHIHLEPALREVGRKPYAFALRAEKIRGTARRTREMHERGVVRTQFGHLIARSGTLDEGA
ncbi:hypothetical protein [Streptomyces phytophilus]|uniref:hypothetical protein n=1 Tax=Streptomyces phytophilus TaxID=722715 RepID=UPI0015EFFCEE|nr:hypothetical protein [Streptomyces phytophilus]